MGLATVTGSNIASATVGGSNIAVGTVTGGSGGNLASNTITAANIFAGTITGGTSGCIGSATITSYNIALGTISVDNMGAVAANSVLANATSSSAVPTTYVISSGYVLGNLSGTLAAVQATAASTATTVVARDSSSNIYVNSVAENLTPPGASVGLTAASSPVQYYSSGTYTVTLPNVSSGFAVGRSYTVVNDGTGTITVKDGGSNTLIYLTRWMRCKFTLAAVGSAAGSWVLAATSMMPPVKLYTNTFASALGTGTLTAAQMYNGPMQCAADNVTLTLPTYTALVGDLTTATSLMGILGFMPPNGFNFRSIFVPGAISKNITINGSGVAGVAYVSPGGLSFTHFNGMLVVIDVVLDTVNSQYYAITGAH